MNSNPICGRCGAPLQPGSQFCTSCGALQGAGPANTQPAAGWQPGNAPTYPGPAPQQNYYGQNPAPPQGYAQGQGYQPPPYQAGGYGQQQASGWPPGQTGAAGAPGYGGAYYGGQQAAPQEKKRRGGVIALIVVLVIGAALGLLYWLGSMQDTAGSETPGPVVQEGAAAQDGGEEGTGGMAVDADTPLLVDYRSYDLTELSDGPGFSFDALNQSGKTITYIEAWVFCFDENGNAIVGDDGSNLEWVVDELTLANGATHTPDDNGYWLFYNCSDVAIVVPYINYVEFEDGMSWGKTASTADITDALRPTYDEVSAQAANTALSLAGQMSFGGLPVADQNGNYNKFWNTF